MKTDTEPTHGSCHCGAVNFQVTGALRGVVNCHCNQCTRLYGNFASHTKAANENIHIIDDTYLSWYQISTKTRRGFCSQCGSGLFWQIERQNSTCITAGSLDVPTGLTTVGHIYVKDKSDYYEITDKHQQFKSSSNGKLDQ